MSCDNDGFLIFAFILAVALNFLKMFPDHLHFVPLFLKLFFASASLGFLFFFS